MNVRILIIEDNPKIAASMKKGLDQHRFSVDVCHTGFEGEDLAWSASGATGMTTTKRWSSTTWRLSAAPAARGSVPPSPAIGRGIRPPIKFPGARVISASIHLTSGTTREGRLGGILFCAGDSKGTASFGSGYSIVWIDRTEDHGY